MSSIIAMIAICAGLATSAGSPSHPPLALHPENPHYFLFRGQPTLLITSGEHYGALLNLDFDYDRYFKTLAKDRLNLTRLFSGAYREIPGSFGITDNTLAPLEGRYLAPWARSEAPGYSLGGAEFDLTKWDPAYFARLKSLMTSASRHGVVVEMNLFCPNYEDALWKANPMYAGNNVNGIGACPSGEAYNGAHADLMAIQVALTQKLVEELSGFDNLYFEVCNEPYFGGVTMEWQKRIAAVIVETESRLKSRHLISLNIANGREKIGDAHPEISIFNFHYATPPDAVGMNYVLNRPIGDNETGFRGPDDHLYRTEAWEFVLAGGSLYNNLDYSFSAAHPDGTLAGYKSPGGGSPVLRKELRVLRDFMAALPFLKMAPAPELIVGELPEGVRAHVLSWPGHTYALYLLGGTQAHLELRLPAGHYRASWVDPRSGAVMGDVAAISSDGSCRLTSPNYREDIALVIRHGK